MVPNTIARKNGIDFRNTLRTHGSWLVDPAPARFSARNRFPRCRVML
jgi:rRNA maturation protein Nop10